MLKGREGGYRRGPVPGHSDFPQPSPAAAHPVPVSFMSSRIPLPAGLRRAAGPHLLTALAVALAVLLGALGVAGCGGSAAPTHRAVTDADSLLTSADPGARGGPAREHLRRNRGRRPQRHRATGSGARLRPQQPEQHRRRDQPAVDEDHPAVQRRRAPQHVTPSYDLRTLYVDNDVGNSLTPIDPQTGRPGRPIPVEDPYNLYFTPDGRFAIVVAERLQRLDFRDPHTLRLVHTLSVPACRGVDHMDFSADGRYAYASCEFAGRMIEVDLQTQRLVRTITVNGGNASPQDVKLSPDGRTLYAADQLSGGVWEIDPARFRVLRLLKTGAGAHGLYSSRDARVMYVSNRQAGTVSVVSFRSRRVIRTWQLPLPASPDMGGVSADGRVLWLSGRYDAVVYAIDTRTGHEIGGSRSASARMGCVCGRSRAATRSATPASCAEPPRRARAAGTRARRWPGCGALCLPDWRLRGWRARSAPAPTVIATLRGVRSAGLGTRHLEHAVLELCGDRLGVDALGQPQRAAECARAALDPVIAAGTLLVLGPGARRRWSGRRLSSSIAMSFSLSPGRSARSDVVVLVLDQVHGRRSAAQCRRLRERGRGVEERVEEAVDGNGFPADEGHAVLLEGRYCLSMQYEILVDPCQVFPGAMPAPACRACERVARGQAHGVQRSRSATAPVICDRLLDAEQRKHGRSDVGQHPAGAQRHPVHGDDQRHRIQRVRGVRRPSGSSMWSALPWSAVMRHSPPAACTAATTSPRQWSTVSIAATAAGITPV